MKASFRAIALLCLCLLFSLPVHAVLERVGDTDSANGFPRWYQDTTGLSLELCLPQNQAELEGGHCLLVPGDPPQVPEVFPNAFFDEHFWWAADATLTPANGGRALLVLALEAAFAADVVAGGQIAFTRIRVRLDPVPVAGAYRFIHPYGEESIEAAAGARIFFTDDVGIGCQPGDFSCAMQGRVGPFLLPSVTSGGAELPAIAGPVPGKLYIADPGRVGPVTGSPLPAFVGSDGLLHDHNVFRIEGPPGSALGGPGIDFIQTNDFTLVGRVFSGQIPSQVTLERASYTRNATGQKVDVFAIAQETAPSRLPGNIRPAGVAPVMSFFDAACVASFDAQNQLIGLSQPSGALETLMLAQGTRRWAQIQPAAGTTLPDSVCVKDNAAVDVNGIAVPSYHQLAVNDEVKITRAFYDVVNGSLTVDAESSDQLVVPTLNLSGFGNFVNGTLTLAGITSPPARLRVLSSARGSAEHDVETGFGSGAGGGQTLVASNDVAATDEDVAVLIPVINGDTLNGVQIDPAVTPVSLAIVAGAGKGAVSVNNATGSVSYTPNANANGSDTFTYTVTSAGVTSNIATVTVNINPVNDPPVGNPDAASGAVNIPLVIAVLNNDTDVDGTALSIAAGSVTQPVGPVGSLASAMVNADGTISFTGDMAGSYSFTYQVSDGTVMSAPVPVSVTLVAPENLAIAVSEFRTTKSDWRVDGTSTVIGATITVYVGPTLGGQLLGTTTVVAGGAWSLRLSNSAILPDASRTLSIESSGGSSRLAISVTVRR